MSSVVPQMSRPEKLLIVDDNPGDRTLLTAYLGEIGAWEIKEVKTVSAAVSLLKTFRPVYILLDWYFPGVQKHDAIVIVRAAAPDAVIVSITGSFQASVAGEAGRAGADAYHNKNKGAEELAAAMRGGWARKEQRRKDVDNA